MENTKLRSGMNFVNMSSTQISIGDISENKCVICGSRGTVKVYMGKSVCASCIAGIKIITTL